MAGFKRDVVINLLFSGIKALVLVGSIFVASKKLSPEILGLVLLFRRQSSVIASVVCLGQSQSILKFNNGHAVKQHLYECAIKMCCCFLAVFLAFLLLFSQQMSTLLFSKNSSLLSLLFAVYVTATVVNFLAYSSWLSLQKYIAANVTELLSLGLVFLLSIFIFENDLIGLLAFNAITALIICISSLYFFSRQYKSKSLFLMVFTKFGFSDYKECIAFGVPRGISAFLDSGMYVIGPWMLVHQIAEAGYLLLALTFLKILQVALVPIAQVLSLRLLQNNAREVDEKFRLFCLLVTAIGGAICMMLLYSFYKVELLSFWLSGSANNTLFYTEQLIVVVPALVGFYLLRNYVDLHYERAYTLYFLVAWFVIFFVSMQVYEVTTQLQFNEVVLFALRNAFLLFYIYIVAFGLSLITAREAKCS